MHKFNLFDMAKEPISVSHKEELMKNAINIATYYGDEYIYKDGTGKYFLFNRYSLHIKYIIKGNDSQIIISNSKDELFNSNSDEYIKGDWEKNIIYLSDKFNADKEEKKLSNRIAFCGRYLAEAMHGSSGLFYIDDDTAIEIFLYEEDNDFPRKPEYQIIFNVYVNKENVFKSIYVFNLNKVDFSDISPGYQIKNYKSGLWEQKIINYVIPFLNNDSLKEENELVKPGNNGIRRIRRYSIN